MKCIGILISTLQITCYECSKPFASKHNLDNHIMKEHNGMSIKFKCMVDGCTAVLYSREGLYKHCN